MEEEGYSFEALNQTAPVRVEVTNFTDFHEDLAKKVAAACVVAVAVGVVKIGMDVLDEKRKERKAAKKAEKAHLKSTKPK